MTLKCDVCMYFCFRLKYPLIKWAIGRVCLFCNPFKKNSKEKDSKTTKKPKRKDWSAQISHLGRGMIVEEADNKENVQREPHQFKSLAVYTNKGLGFQVCVLCMYVSICMHGKPSSHAHGTSRTHTQYIYLYICVYEDDTLERCTV